MSETTETKYELRLFVTGQTPRSINAISNIRRLCERELPGRYKLTIVDVLEQPQLAENERIMATPTLIKITPPPAMRIIGDLSDSRRVFVGLNLRPEQSKT
jgi:circadian clock protein KaiB